MAEVREIGVVGAGFMGSGIAESAARAGLRVRVYEPSDAPLRLSKGRIEASVERAVRGGKMDEEQARALQERISFSSELHSLHGSSSSSRRSSRTSTSSRRCSSCSTTPSTTP